MSDQALITFISIATAGLTVALGSIGSKEVIEENWN